MAKKKEMALVFVLEDDVQFIDSAHEKLGKALASVPDDWDVLLGGCYSDIKQDTFDWNNKRHALTSDYHHYEKVFKGIKEHKLDHLHQHIVKIADEYLRSQASLVLDKYRFRNQF